MSAADVQDAEQVTIEGEVTDDGKIVVESPVNLPRGRVVLTLRAVQQAPAEEQGEPRSDDPEAIVERVLELLSEGSYKEASDRAQTAASRFPSHERLQKLARALDKHGQARPSEQPPEASTDEEFEWLRNPPEWARGKWVALVGSEAVAVGDTLREVSSAVRAQHFPKRPLVHRVD